MRRRIALAGLVLFAAVGVAAAVDTNKAWNGTWRLDQGRSHTAGPSFEITATTKGFHFAGSTGLSYDFACDGKDYPLGAGSDLSARSVACTKNADGSYDTWSKVDGKEMSRSHRVIAADGLSMTVETTSNGSDGKPVMVDGDVLKATNVFRRVVPEAPAAAKAVDSKQDKKAKPAAKPEGKSDAKIEAKPAPKLEYSGLGLAGKWENTHSAAMAPAVAILTMRGEVMHLDYPLERMVVTATLDGKDSPVGGDNAEDKQTLAVTPEGASVLHLVSKIDGQPTLEALQTLSTDGKTLTSTEWKPGREKEKSVFVYAKE